MHHARLNKRQGKGPALNFLLSVMLGLMIGSAPALAAVEQCRFIQARTDREACYQRQATALARAAFICWVITSIMRHPRRKTPKAAESPSDQVLS